MTDIIFDFIVQLQVKALILIILASTLVLLLKHFQAKHRQVVWRQLTALLLVLPVLILVLPSVKIDLPTWRDSAPPVSLQSNSNTLKGTNNSTERGKTVSPTIEAVAVQPSPIKQIESQSTSLKTILIGAYLLVALSLSLRLLSGIIQVYFKIIRLNKIQLPDIPRDIEVRINDNSQTPFVWGLFKPTIVVPKDFSVYSQKLQRNILHHEQTHIQNKDWLLAVLTKFCCCLYWFNPAIWLVARQSQLEAEKICDEQIVASGQAGESYAEQLVHIAKSLKKPTIPQFLAPSMAGMSSLRRRIDNLLSNRRRREMKPFNQKCLQATFFMLSVFFIALNSQGQTPVNRDKQNIDNEQPGYVRLRAVTPEYPTSAAKKGIEGFTVVEYDILPSGTLDNIRVIESEPVGLFDQASIDALQRWLYMPEYIDGKAIATKGVRNRLSFKLDKFPKVSITPGELEYIQERGPQSASEARNLIKYYLTAKDSSSATTTLIDYLLKTQSANLNDALYLIESVQFKGLDQEQVAKFIHRLRNHAEQDDSGDTYALLAQLFRGMENWPAAQLSLMKAFERGQLSAPGATTYNLSVVLFNTHSYGPALRVIDTAIAKYGENEHWATWRKVVKRELDRKNLVGERLMDAVTG